MIAPARRLFLALAATAAAAMPIAAAPTVASAQTPYLRVPASEPKYAAIVVDANSGEVLYAKRAVSPRYPASITKVMTLYLVFEAMAEGRLKTTVYLARADKDVAVATGSRLDEGYVVEAIRDDGVHLLFPPSKARALIHAPSTPTP